ncbi:stage V sporulation protein AA [Anaerovirgula multivorans]|uniref:Stage V sporulation protein AA n=1 Tax=Anaerovirgula multivorans TaxID=312168 RepID=A0A239DWH9_9FIRM|nr:stage V sporulation protein AA [Anaerovirgula multivorans]SNS36707.1 stage V sporulation protein AA [Anaerovirgula multivorans]
MDNIIYIQSKKKVKLEKNQPILLKDLMDIYSSDYNLRKEIENIEYKIQDKKIKNTFIISVFSIISLINLQFPNSNISVIGETDILVSFQHKSNREDSKGKLIRVILVCFLLFVGAATAIINFHSDVDMPETQKTIYRIITGKESDNLLLLQIPYSLGIGVGMSVFFNHIFRKRINNEPSPLEVEVHLYQENLDQYIKNNSEKHTK